MTGTIKKYDTIGCCGIDCGLCPRYYTDGDSACPGCGGLNFRDKHPSCGYLTCCAIKKGHEVCSECEDYRCKRFDSEKDGYDSFVTHKKVFINLDFIKENGIDYFIAQQKQRINILRDFIDNFDDGRSKNYFCLCCALLPLDKLNETHGFIKSKQSDRLSTKEQNIILKDKLQMIADNLDIELKLNKKK
ncbi:MAG: DUF3795 domain-containing protein [Salinivirgaceae bacterium]|nr:DUF3795 domain-containing protein [Salinivirgaceae bacterium]